MTPHRFMKSPGSSSMSANTFLVRPQLSATRLAERQQSEAHAKAEEDMRRAFMRTVCALNIEVRTDACCRDRCAAEPACLAICAEATLTEQEL